MLPTDTLRGVIVKNRWCGYGRRRAKVFHRVAGSPEKVNARHILDALMHLRKRWPKYGNSYQNHDDAFRAICRLMDVEHGRQILAELRKLKRPGGWSSSEGYQSHYPGYWNWQTQTYTRGVRRRRRYPRDLRTGHQLWSVLQTFSYDDRIAVLDKVLPKNS